MRDWFKHIRESFRAWCKSNAEAHCKAAPRSCCSAPPPDAGGRDAKTGH